MEAQPYDDDDSLSGTEDEFADDAVDADADGDGDGDGEGEGDEEEADDEEDEDFFSVSSEPVTATSAVLSNQPPLNIHSCVYTRFELAAALSLRSEQLAKNAPPLVPATSFAGGRYPDNPLTIAQEEYRQRRLPLKVHRTLPNGASYYHSLVPPE